MPILFHLIDILIAFIIDLIVGDPYRLPHPVRYIGWIIRNCETLLRRVIQKGQPEKRERRERVAGGILMLATVLATVLPVLLLLALASFVHSVLFHLFNIYFLYAALAVKCLADEAKKVHFFLAAGKIPEARRQLSMLVGRQTDHLEEKEIVRGAVETTAENTVDGIISPLFYAILGSLFGMGAPVVWAFKAISTLDSMVGYKNEKYLHFGRISAKTDDAANYVPARLSGVIIPAGAFFCGMDWRRSFRIMQRDRRNHKSPNCAYPEAAFAGALGVRIGGDNIYFGKVVEKPTIGDPDKEIGEEDIPAAVRLMYAAAVITLLAGLGLAAAILFRTCFVSGGA
jgi:adenosylcobinamide-phosphate synthase